MTGRLFLRVPRGAEDDRKAGPLYPLGGISLRYQLLFCQVVKRRASRKRRGSPGPRGKDEKRRETRSGRVSRSVGAERIRERARRCEGDGGKRERNTYGGRTRSEGKREEEGYLQNTWHRPLSGASWENFSLFLLGLRAHGNRDDPPRSSTILHDPPRSSTKGTVSFLARRLCIDRKLFLEIDHADRGGLLANVSLDSARFPCSGVQRMLSHRKE